MSQLIQRLGILAHPQLEKSLGYAAKNRWVAWHWEPEIQQLVHQDSQQAGTGSNLAWQVFLEHPENSALQTYQLNERDDYWLLLDRKTRNFYIGEEKAIQSLLEEPESLTLLACLEGEKPVVSSLTQRVQKQLRSPLVPMLIGFAAMAISATCVSLWLSQKSNLPQPASKTLLPPPVHPDKTCGINGSSDFSTYILQSTSGRELHLIGVYEARSDHSGGYHPQGDIAVNIQRQGVPLVLVLSAYEPVTWHLNLEPGVIIEKIILNGYHDQIIAGAGNILVEEYSAEGTGKTLSDYHPSRWSAETPNLIRPLEKMTQASFSSFQGCYRGTSFTLK